jgi:hypothetical protein
VITRPPDPHDWSRPGPFVFLAGSIEMGAARDWQADLALVLAEAGAHVLNPRRADWDSSWEQRARNPEFRGQVQWELDGLDHADLVLMHFEPETKSPITLLELGLFAGTDGLLVSCPDGFWRKGNVELVCERWHVQLFDHLEQLTERALERVRELRAEAFR